jgi:hypothetical protein
VWGRPTPTPPAPTILRIVATGIIPLQEATAVSSLLLRSRPGYR